MEILKWMSFFLFYLLFGYAKVRFGSLTRGHPRSPDVDPYIMAINFRPEGHRYPCKEVGSLSPTDHPIGCEAGIS